jgi:hypothetical protein
VASGDDLPEAAPADVEVVEVVRSPDLDRLELDRDPDPGNIVSINPAGAETAVSAAGPESSGQF